MIAGSNRTDLRNTRGGELVGPVATHYLPPDFPGFEEAGGLEGSGLDYLANPDGDPELAAKYFEEAGMSSGKCEGDCEITMVGDDSPPGSDTAEVFKNQLEEMGFTVNFQKVTHDIMYTKFCSVPENAPDVCPNVGWLKDFNDGQSMLDPTFNGDNVVPENNSNWPQLDVPEVNEAIDDGDADRRPGGAQPGVGRRRHADHRAGPGGPVGLGQPGEHRLGRRGGSDQQVQRELGSLVHVAEVVGIGRR